jgi:hypothetical protein
MDTKVRSGSKNPLENKEFLSRLIYLENKMMSQKYDFSVIEELILTYTVSLTRNWSSSTTSDKTQSKFTSPRRFKSSLLI